MNYSDGREILVGDTVKYSDGDNGRVVASIDQGVYTLEYAEADWSYLGTGVLVVSGSMGLVHYDHGVNLGFELLNREKTN